MREEPLDEVAVNGDASRLLHELQVHQIELEAQNQELRQAQEEVLALLQRQAEIYDLAPVGYFTLERDSTIRQLNLAGAAMLAGKDGEPAALRAELEGKPFRCFVAAAEHGGFNAFISQVLAGQEKLSCELALADPDDARISRFVRIEGKANPRNSTVNAVVSDITAIRQAELERERYRRHLEEMLDTMEAAKEAAERASQAKTEFLTTTGHELRSPLTNLMVVAQILANNVEGNLTPRQVEYARIIETAGHDLLHFVDDLLDLAHIEAGSLSIQMRSVPFPDVLQGVHRTYREITRQKGLEFGMTIDADVPPAIVTDPVRLQQLLRNLLGNAIKFTRDGSVTLCVRQAVPGARYEQPSLEKADTVIAFDVVDTGPGIAPMHQIHIFEASRPGANGTAFGLPIARRIARLLGGDLKLASVPGKGSTFTVFLPLEPPQKP